MSSSYNILFYNRGEEVNYIPQIDPFVYYFMLEDDIGESEFITSIEDGFLHNTIYTPEDFQSHYESVSPEYLKETLGESAFSKIGSHKYDYFIITFPWFNYALKEVILISRYMKKYINPDLKVIYISEFPKFYESEIRLCYPDDVDHVISGGYHISDEETPDPVMQKILGYSSITEKGTYNFPEMKPGVIPETDMIEYQISRGCIVEPKCFYCTISHIKSAPLYDYDVLTSNLQMLLDAGVKKIYFIDGELNFDNDFFEKVLDFLIENPKKITWSSYILAKNLTPELIKKMHLSGCKHVRLGLESATPSRMNTISKRLKLQEVVEICSEMHNIGIVVQTHFIYGFKGETSQELREMMDFIKENKEVFDLVDFFYLKFRPSVGSYKFGFQKFQLPFVKDNHFMGAGGELSRFLPGDGSVLDKKSYLFMNFLKLIGKEHENGSLATDPRKYFLDHV